MATSVSPPASPQRLLATNNWLKDYVISPLFNFGAEIEDKDNTNSTYSDDGSSEESFTDSEDDSTTLQISAPQNVIHKVCRFCVLVALLSLSV
jgi:hypothetical protein